MKGYISYTPNFNSVDDVFTFEVIEGYSGSMCHQSEGGYTLGYMDPKVTNLVKYVFYFFKYLPLWTSVVELTEN